MSNLSLRENFFSMSSTDFLSGKNWGGNVFLDAGNLWSSWSEINLVDSVIDFGWGLRYYLRNFVARFDMGFSDEGAGIYFSFGHVF